jgi:DNA mismatch repair protein MutS2
MISNETLEKLGFYKVLTHISGYTSTEKGKNLILNTSPYSSLNKIIEQGKFVTEAKELFIKEDYPPIEYLPNLDEALSRSNISGLILNKTNVRNILTLAVISRKVKNYLLNYAQNTNLEKEYSGKLFKDKNFEHSISKIFNESGEINDNASKKLKEIRKEIIGKSDQLKSVINKILKNLSNSYLVQEEYVTQRDGRLVLPIKAEHKRHIKGFIHSESNTGQTVYIEPEATLDLNNEILSLNFAEKREIERILKEVTQIIGQYSNELKLSLKTITELDVIFAKAKYSLETIGAFPTINKDKRHNIIDGRHPLLLKKIGREKTIPLNFTFGKDNVILITGPNAGGKTVVLKTIALLSAMVQSGIHIPVHPDSNFHFFENIMMDIGDEQSIEDDLSTFSSHLSNIKNIISQSDVNTLVLIDEIGTGTDPSEGTALAASFLITLKNKNAKVVATTHHGNLKILATEIDKFQNASMEFDIENLEPTYKFRQGVPGSSYAFEVAKKIGLDDEILSLAEQYLDSDKNKVEKFIIDLENKSLQLSKKLDALEIENTRLQGLTKLYEKQNEKLKEEKGKILKETKEKADEFLMNINSKFENTIKRIKETKAETKIIKEEKNKIDQLKKEIKKTYSEPQNSKPTELANIDVGDYVTIKDSFTSGEIIEIEKNKNVATLDTGNLRIKVKLNNLIKSKRKKEKYEQQQSGISITQTNTTLDIRGQKPEEAEFEIIKFIDDAYLANLKDVEIIHGKGTGVLRITVHEILKNHDLVKDFNLADIKSGGHGATIVKLKED